MKNQIIFIFISLIVLCSCSLNDDRPNVIFILADDMGYGDLACQNPESKVPTPFLDDLASEGMRFTDAHSPSSVCTPTRYAILTGRYAWRTRLKKGVLWQWDTPLIENEYTVGKMFKDAGYQTACIGKWHLGWEWAFPDSVEINRTLPGNLVDYAAPIKGGPLAKGFDYYFGDDVPNFQPYTFIENDKVVTVPTVMKPDSLFGGRGMMAEGWRLEMVMPTITQKAVEYIQDRTSNQDSKPYFLYFTLTAPHTPIAPTEEFHGKSQAGLYGDFVNEVDFCVGEVLKAIRESGTEDNTLVIFTSDNGSPGRNGENWSGPVSSVKRDFGHDPSFPWKGVKSDIWEGGHHVPYLVRWPGNIKAGSVNGELIGHLDFMKTMSEILNVEMPLGSAPDSYNILPAYFNENDTPIREALVHHSGGGMFAIRQGPWKLCFGLGPAGFSGGFKKAGKGEPPGQLYNIESDPQEKHNVYLDNPDVVEHLSNLLEKYKTEGRSVE